MHGLRARVAPLPSGPGWPRRPAGHRPLNLEPRTTKEDTMNRTQAVSTARKLYKEGVTQQEIAQKLLEGGFPSKRTGGALHATAVGQMIKRKARTKPKDEKS